MMKHFITGMLLTLTLVVAIVMGVVALAESTPAEAPQLPSVEETPATDAQAPAEATDTDDQALQAAMDAYRAARGESRMEDLEKELSDFVASGKLTQEQADLILNASREREALRNGECPNCGYAFQSNGGFGKGGRMNGGMGGRMNGGMGGRMNGGMDSQMNGGMGSQMNGGMDSQMNNGMTNGTAFEFDWDDQADTLESGAI